MNYTSMHVSPVPQPPTITLQSPKDFIFDPRENIVIHCEAKGNPHPSFDVEKDSKVLMKRGSGTLVIDISGEKAEAYEGTYQCTASNEHGKALSNNIVIRQSRSPLWSKERNEQIVVKKGLSLLLPCRPPAGLPPPVIFWMDNKNPEEERSPGFMLPLGNMSTKMVLRGETLELECIAEGLFKDGQTNIKNGDPYVIHENGTLEIIVAQPLHSGKYTCTATNNLGFKENHVFLEVKEFLIEYMDLLHQPGVWVNLTEVAGTSTTAQLQLSPYIYYTFRVRAQNEVGYSNPSDPSAQYRTNPSGFQSNGPGLEYKVQWRQKDVEDDWTSKNVVNVSQLIVSGTPTYVPYEIKVQAFNDYGNGPEPAVVIGFSGEDRK
ncbi:hypothetical protein GOODEAATRI_012733 [Goodea atripinnis]|uniref:Uncharacterized protein n=1 Tax=Goodea atripinnis TaxID=208336 RepID=A0ABV0PN81_9TELE